MDRIIYLVLEDGRVFEGRRFGAEGEVTGELVFTTGMTGYLETINDPAYFGQIVVQTFPLIGNYGVIPADCGRRKPFLSAYIVREWCREPSNFRCEGDLDTYLKEQGVVGLYDIDTRALTRIIRENGVMNARIVTSLDRKDEAAAAARAYRIQNAVAETSCQKAEEFRPENPKFRVALWDFGACEATCQELLEHGCEVLRFPSFASAEEILARNPDGIVLSDGPGDPAENTGIIEEIRKAASSGKPVFGISLGHQMMAIAQGAETEKLKYGHRGANQPVEDTETGRVYITGQNHGYAVKSDTLPPHAKVRFVNANDNSCEGIDYQNAPIFTVQFHPESCSGPQDAAFLFDRFLDVMQGR